MYELNYLLPLMFPVLGALILLVAGNFHPRQRSRDALIGVVVLLLGSIYLEYALLGSPQAILWGGLFSVNPFTFGASLALSLFMMSSIWFLISHQNQGAACRTFTVLVLLSMMAIKALLVSAPVLAVVLFLESLAGGLVAMSAGDRQEVTSLEAATKYFSSNLFGLALFILGYALTARSVKFEMLSDAALLVKAFSGPAAVSVTLGTCLMAAYFLNKIGVAPFHGPWVNFLDGAPAPVALWASTVVLPATLCVLLRLAAAMPNIPMRAQQAVSAVGLLTVIAGFGGALRQTRWRRLFAYLCVGQTGLFLMPWASGAPAELSLQAAEMWFVSSAASLICVGILGLLLETWVGRPALVSDLQAQMQKRPLVSFLWTLALAAFAGAPPFLTFHSWIQSLSLSVERQHWGGAAGFIIGALLRAMVAARLATEIHFKATVKSPETFEKTGWGAVVPSLILISALFVGGMASSYLVKWLESLTLSLV